MSAHLAVEKYSDRFGRIKYFIEFFGTQIFHSFITYKQMESSWFGYTQAIGNQDHPICAAPPVSKYPATDGNKWWTGFQGLTPANPAVQAKYDAMSATWEGVSPTNAAVINGLFASEAMPLDKTLPARK
jgi:hypothetical protein